jgi:hypothetical protein
MKDRKPYWRQRQARLRSLRKSGTETRAPGLLNGPSDIDPVKWPAFLEVYRAECKRLDLGGQVNWRARARLKVRLLREAGLDYSDTPLDWLPTLISKAKPGARARSLIFEIGPDDFDPPTRCPILDCVLDYPSLNTGLQYNTPSLDRIDNSLGYVPGNVQIVSHRANKLKNDATLAELQKLGEWAAQQVSKK